jgi:polysaccharide export outer membrane protein
VSAPGTKSPPSPASLSSKGSSAIVRSIGVAALLVLSGLIAAAQVRDAHASQQDVQAVPAVTDDTLASDLAGDYVIGVEDVLYVAVWKNPDLSREVPVRPDGKITLPLIDDISAVGLTPSRLKEILTERWKSYITGPEVSVIVTQVNSLKVYMVGEIARPGILQLKSKTRLLQAISLAGGFTSFAERTKIVVLRNNGSGESRLEFNYKKILSGSRPADNIFLKPGDTVIVP